jgi:hypothetical protein
MEQESFHTLSILFTGYMIMRLRKEHRLRVSENGVVKRIFEPKRDEMTKGWRKLHKEELLNFYSSPSIIRIIKSM